MYVIFPADEVVYLSYDRVLLIPGTTNRESNNQQASPSTASQSTGSYTSHPSTSNSSTRSKQSVASAPPTYNGYAENHAKRSPKPTITKSKSFKTTTPEEQPPVRPRRTKKEQKQQQQQKTSLEKPTSFLQLPSRSKSKTPERRLSFSDYLSQNRERTPNCSTSGGGKSKSPSPSGPSPGEGYFRTNKRVCCLECYFRY